MGGSKKSVLLTILQEGIFGDDLASVSHRQRLRSLRAQNLKKQNSPPRERKPRFKERNVTLFERLKERGQIAKAASSLKTSSSKKRQQSRNPDDESPYSTLFFANAFSEPARNRQQHSFGDKRASTAYLDGGVATRESEVSLSRGEDGVYLVMKNGRETERRLPESRLVLDERRRRSTLIPRNATDEEEEEDDEAAELGGKSSLER